MSSPNELKLDWLDHERRDLVIICPGGGYHFTSHREAEPIAHRFHEKGFHTGILYYRQTMTRYPELIDEMVNLIRPWRNDRRVGRLIIIGFSAGGHLAGLLVKAQPDWFKAAIFAYSVISAQPAFDPNGSMTNLLGREMTPTERDELSIELHVTPTWPPVFIWSTSDDDLVSIDHSIALIRSCRKHQVPVEVHFYRSGPHGLVLANRQTPWDTGDPLEYERLYSHMSNWFDLMLQWLCNTLYRRPEGGCQ